MSIWSELHTIAPVALFPLVKKAAVAAVDKIVYNRWLFALHALVRRHGLCETVAVQKRQPRRAAAGNASEQRE